MNAADFARRICITYTNAGIFFFVGDNAPGSIGRGGVPKLENTVIYGAVDWWDRIAYAKVGKRDEDGEFLNEDNVISVRLSDLITGALYNNDVICEKLAEAVAKLYAQEPAK